MKKYWKYAFVFGIIKKAVILIFLFSNFSYAQESKMFFNLSLEDKPRDLSNWFASWYLSVASHISEMGLNPKEHMYITPENETRTIRFGTLPSGVLAVAQQVYNDCNIDIVINSKDWFNTYQQKRMWVYYHEMAHDAFNLDHGEGGELMNAYVPNDKITSLRLYNAIRTMVRYAVRYGKYERGTGFCSNGTIYRKNGTNYVSKRGSVYRDHQGSSSSNKVFESNDERYYSDRANEKYKKGDFYGAILDMGKAIAANPNIYQNYILRGIMNCYGEGDLSSCVDCNDIVKGWEVAKENGISFDIIKGIERDFPICYFQ